MKAYWNVDEIEVLSSPNDFKLLQQSIMWQDITKVLLKQKEDCAIDFDNVDPKDEVEIVRIQTRRQMIDHFLGLPDVLIEDIIAGQPEEEEVTEDAT